MHHVFNIGTSIGIAVYPRDGDNSDELLQHADAAMYRAKEQGGNAAAFFMPEMAQATAERLRLEAGLRRAIAQDELRLHYQPIVDAVTGRIAAAEALVRWQDPERGLVPPVQFIPVAEETGLIVPMGEWVLREACRQARRWHDDGHTAVQVAVNLSPRQFGEPTLEWSVAQALTDAQCPAHLLQLEITESTVMSHADQALATMQGLTSLGVALSIDDFGTGYSSLGRLQQFPVSKLKIDRAFVQRIRSGTADEFIVDAVVTLARKLGLRTVAEGVETEEQVSFLSALGCNEYQGYLFGKPCDAEAFAELLRRRNPPLPA
jgi:EAL domain-containing protein (putative c-di-GMP-specific phosphodiesterase class I)